jgi:hypothetical protein
MKPAKKASPVAAHNSNPNPRKSGQKGAPPDAPQTPHAVPGTNLEAPKAVTEQAAASTHDFELLNSSGPDFIQQNFTRSEPWRIFRIMSEFVHSFEIMSKVGPAVAVFGSARLPEDSPYYQATVEVSERLARAGWCVITGGGPGIMEASNKGAQMVQNFPVILFGRDYWCGLLNWMEDVMVPHGTILPTDLDLMMITDDPQEVVQWVMERTQQVRNPSQAASVPRATRSPQPSQRPRPFVA